jgi:ParB family transcriptional regulator, chromosome partitioning protein
LGLLGPVLARRWVRLPAGNQEAVLALTRRATLTAQEVSGVIDLLQGASEEQAAFVLAKPREALAQARGLPTALRDPRLSRAGNWLARHLTQALEALVRLEHWLRTPGERELTTRDREIVQPLLLRVGDQASLVAELVLGPQTTREHRRT